MQKAAPSPKAVGPNRIDYFEEEGVDQGIWYPDENEIHMVWTGGEKKWDQHTSQKEFDPFKISKSFTGKMKIIQKNCREINLFHSLYTFKS